MNIQKIIKNLKILKIKKEKANLNVDKLIAYITSKINDRRKKQNLELVTMENQTANQILLIDLIIVNLEPFSVVDIQTYSQIIQKAVNELKTDLYSENQFMYAISKEYQYSNIKNMEQIKQKYFEKNGFKDIPFFESVERVVIDRFHKELANCFIT
jgi:hypothetical protein